MTRPVVDWRTNQREWAEQLSGWLVELGGTAEEIAAALAERGITGRREDARCCPVANYVRGRLGEVAEHLIVEVDAQVEIYDGPRWAGVAYEPLADFVDRFDAEEWPELVAIDEVPGGESF